MALIEGGAAGVLTAKPDRNTLLDQAGECERFGHAIIQRLLAGAHLDALFEQLLYFRMDVKAVRIRGQLRGEVVQFFLWHSGRRFVLGFVRSAEVVVPILRKFAQDGLFGELSGAFLSGFIAGFNGLHARVNISHADLLGVDFPKRRMSFDGLVHQRLSDGWIVDLAMAVAAIADQVDHDVAAKFVTILGGDPSDAENGIDILAVDVKNRNRLPPRELRRKSRRMFFAGVGGKSDQVVHDDVDRPTNGITCEVGVIQSLGGDALSSERGIAVDEHREILRPAAVSRTVLLGTRTSNGDGIDCLQMARIGRQMDVDLGSAFGDILAGRTHVIFHVARTEHAARIHVLEFAKDLFRGALRDIDNDVQSSAMAHPHDEFDGAVFAGHVEDFVQQRQERSVAFEREALVAEIARLQRLLKQVRLDQQVKRQFMFDMLGFAFQTLLDPAPALWIGNVHEFRAHAPAIDAARFPGPFIVDLEVGVRLRRQESQRIQFCFQVSPLAEQFVNPFPFKRFHASGGRAATSFILSRSSHKSSSL